MLISKFEIINFKFEYLLFLYAQISKQLMKIQNGTRSQLSTGIISTKLTLWKIVERSDIKYYIVESVRSKAAYRPLMPLYGGELRVVLNSIR